MAIKEELLKGVFWSAVEKYSGVVVALVISAVLARLISPEDFGVVAIATVIISFLSMFSSMGIAPAIIQRNDLSEKNLDSIFTWSIVIGAILALILFACAKPIAGFYENELLVPVCRILSVNLFFAALNLVPNALMAKNKRFKQIAKRTLSLQVLGGGIAIAAAYWGAGIYALLISPLITSIGVPAVNLTYYPRRLDLHFDLSPFKKIFSYAGFQFLFEFMNYFSRNLDKLIIGRYMGMSDLGYYDKSYRLMMQPLQKVTFVLNPVLQPVLSYLQDERRVLAEKYRQIIKSVANIGFPLAVFIFFSAGELIRTVYGEAWLPAVPAFRILALSLPFQMVLSTSGSIFQAGNSTKHLFLVGLRNTLCTVAGFFIGALCFGTIEAVAWSFVITNCINFAQTYLTMYRKVLYSPLTAMLKELLHPVVNALVLSALLLPLHFFPLSNALLSLGIKTALSLIVTLALLQTWGDFDLRGSLRKSRNKKSGNDE